MKNNILIIPLLFLWLIRLNAQWERTNLPDTIKVNVMAVNDSSLFAGTNGKGIFVSKNNGDTWKSINAGLENKIIHALYVDGETIFAGTEAGASISTDYGISWSSINSGLDGKGVWSFLITDGNNIVPDTTIFAGTWSGIYYSTNQGQVWQPTSVSESMMPIHSIVSHNNYIFAATISGGLFNSFDKGFSWRRIIVKDLDRSEGINEVVPAYSLAYTNNNVVVGSRKGTIYFTAYDDSLFSIASSISFWYQPIISFAVRNATLFAGNTVGNIAYSSNGGAYWNLFAYSLRKESLYSLVVNKEYLFAGTQNGVWRLWYPDTSASTNNSKNLSEHIILEQNYPNPFNPITTIKYTIPKIDDLDYLPVQLKVFNLLGEEVAVLVDEYQKSSDYKVQFDGSHLSSGVYIYKIQVRGYSATKKLILLK